MKVNRQDLVQLFDKEQIIYDEEAGVYNYKKYYSAFFTLTLNFYELEDRATIRLDYHPIKHWLFDVGMHNIKVIEYSANSLFFYRANNVLALELVMFPFPSLKVDCGENRPFRRER